jgi:phosphatidyl-myo-inositol dimannoside synthase
VHPDILLLTELFPPAIGGTPVLFENVYSRIEGVKVQVLTDEVTSAPLPGSPAGGKMEIHYGPIQTRRWGVANLRGLAHHLCVALRVRALTRGRKTVVHCGRALPEGVAALFCRALLGPRFVVWAHGEDITTALMSRELTILMKLVYRRAAAVFANSMNTLSMLRNIGVAEEKIQIVYPGVDSERFHPAADGSAIRQRFARPGQIVLLSVGRHQRRKGHDHAIEAVAALCNELPNLRYVITGDGIERDRLEALVTRLGLRERVIFVGEVTHEELPSYYAACDIFLHPNRIDDGDIEGFGIVFLEAAASGKAVIGGRTGGVPEAVEDGVTGILVSGTDVFELAAAIRKLISSSELRLRMGAEGRARVLRGFTWPQAALAVGATHAEAVFGRKEICRRQGGR